jgi:membrane fusion protein, multidrug efflux system
MNSPVRMDHFDTTTQVDEINLRGRIRSDVTKPPVRLSKKLLVLIAAAVVLASGGAYFARYWWTTGRFIETTNDAYVGGDVTSLSPKIAGFIATVAVADNQFVKAGDLLVKIDDRDYRAQLARAQASVALQQATLENLEANRRLQLSVIAQASAEVSATTAEMTRTKYDFDRYQTLSNSHVASLQRFEQADADYEKAQAAERKARAVLDAAQRQLDVIDSQKLQTKAALDQAVADREIAELNLSYTEIRAPIDGVVGNRTARAGSYVTAGVQLLSLVPTDGLWVDANFKESQLAYMRQGQSVDVNADVLPSVTFHGHVASLAPATGAQFSVIPPENATGNFTKIVQRVPVRIRLEDSAATFGKLRPGLSVTASVDTKADSDTRAQQ